MWSPVVHHHLTLAEDTVDDCRAGQVPSTRCKHAVCYDQEKNRVYLLGGRNGNIPLKDFWSFSLGIYVFWFRLDYCGLRFSSFFLLKHFFCFQVTILVLLCA